MKRLLDTNAYVELLKGNGEVAALVRSAEELVFSTIAKEGLVAAATAAVN